MANRYNICRALELRRGKIIDRALAAIHTSEMCGQIVECTGHGRIGMMHVVRHNTVVDQLKIVKKIRLP